MGIPVVSTVPNWHYLGAMGITFGQWLKTKRGRRGEPGFISQQALADRLGVDRTYVVQVENGRIRMPQLGTRQRIHEILGTSEEDLVNADVDDFRHGAAIEGGHTVYSEDGRTRATVTWPDPTPTPAPDEIDELRRQILAVVADLPPRSLRHTLESLLVISRSDWSEPQSRD